MVIMYTTIHKINEFVLTIFYFFIAEEREKCQKNYKRLSKLALGLLCDLCTNTIHIKHGMVSTFLRLMEVRSGFLVAMIVGSILVNRFPSRGTQVLLPGYLNVLMS